MSNCTPQPTRSTTTLAAASHEDNTLYEKTASRRLRRWCRVWRPGILAIATGLVLATAACSGGSSSSSATTSASGSARLAFAQCVRAHGVPNYPDPDSSGQEPSNAKTIGHNNPQFPAASKACAYLIPNGGQESASQIQADQQNDAKFASCMRTHGVPNFPDPTNDDQGRPSFNLTAAHINANSAQVKNAAQTCERQLHLSQLPSIR